VADIRLIRAPDLRGATQKPAELSVLVLTWNRAELLRRCLHSVLGQLGDREELIVVDNGSTDRTGDVLDEFERRAGVRTVRLPENLGCPEGRNVGMAAATGPWVFSVDDDAWLAPGTLARVRHTVGRHPDAAVIAGSCVADPADGPDDGYPVPTFRFSGGVAVIRRDWFDRCGGYPVDGLRQGEERDLAFRLYDAGAHVLRDPALTIVHEADASPDHTRAVLRNAVRQDLTTTLRYYPVALMVPAAAAKLVRYTTVGLRGRITGEVVAGTTDVWRTRRALWASRRAVAWRTIGASLSSTDRWRRHAAGL
jgi:GT2 family glycosyltransferase